MQEIENEKKILIQETKEYLYIYNKKINIDNKIGEYHLIQKGEPDGSTISIL